MSENLNQICYLKDVLPAEVKQIIFDNLSLTDLLSLCLVCQSFDDFIGKSHKCMEKIWIKFYSFKLKDLESLAMSTRKYEKLKVNRVNKSSHFSFLSNLQQNWKKVLIYNCEFKQMQSYIDFIDVISESIEELEISDIEILNNDIEVGQLKFPNLERIMFRNASSTAIEIFLGFNKSLENASFDIAQPIEGKMPLNELTFKFLQRSDKLNHLQLGPHYIKALFDQEDAEVKFNFTLKKLFMKFPLIRDLSPFNATNVSEFLKLQPKIDWILFFEIQSDLVLTTAWNEIEKLSHITFIGLEELFDDSMEIMIEPNENIKQLDLLSRKILISQLRKLFKAAPNLLVLHVQTLTRYVLEFTVKNHQSIKEIRYENIDEDVPDLYNQLKASTEEVNGNIEFRKASFWFDTSNPFLIDPNFWHT